VAEIYLGIMLFETIGVRAAKYNYANMPTN